jgi:hypothetical protein
MVPCNSEVFHTLFHSIVRLSIIPNWSAARCHRCRNLLKDSRVCFGVSALAQLGRFEQNHSGVRHTTASLFIVYVSLYKDLQALSQKPLLPSSFGWFVTLDCNVVVTPVEVYTR